MAVLVSDSFNRANSTSTLGTTDSYNGGTAKVWSIIQGGSGATAGISSNQAYFSSFGSVTNYIFAVVDAGTQNYQIQVKITTLTSLSYLAFRVQDVNNFFMVRYYNSNYELYKRVAGTFTKLGSVAGGAANDVVKVSTDSSGNITVFVNGVSKITTTDTSLLTVTNCGFGNYQTPTGYFDNFQVDDLSGTTPTGTDVSYSYSLKQTIYADRTVQAQTKQEIYADRSNQAPTLQQIYADSVNQYPIKQAFYRDTTVSIPTNQVLYSDRAISYALKQIIYADRSWNYAMEQDLFSDYILYSANFPINQIIYADRVNPFATKQQIWVDRAYEFPTLQEIVEKIETWKDVLHPSTTWEEEINVITIWSDLFKNKGTFN